ncbi:D-glycero-alpha-D-manno-heptose-1,7-bisphosphate 7-phosphatase [Thermodesulfobacteriota bacterium]
MQQSQNPKSRRKAIFLDRDGVINHKLPSDCYVSEASQFRLLPGVLEALAVLDELGFTLVVVTNQRGIARGLMTQDDLDRVHDHMLEQFRSRGIEPAAVYHCPHEKYENCSCRKPEPGMLLAAARDLRLDLEASYMVGDSPSDMEAGIRAGTRTVRISEEEDSTAELRFSGLPEFAEYLRSRSAR